MQGAPRSLDSDADALSIGGAEAAWARSARAGDRAAFQQLYHRYFAMVHAIVLAHAPPRDADDLTQEVFARALRSISTLRDDDRTGAWFGAIARNVARESRRGGRRWLPWGERDVAEPAPAAMPHETQEILGAVLALSETYRETLLMRLVEGMTGPEISARTGMTPGSVRVHLHRGMKLLHEELQRRGIRL